MRKRNAVVCASAALATLVLAPAASAYHEHSLIGGAAVRDGAVALVSDVSDAASANDASAISFHVPAGTTFAELRTLSAEFNVTDDDCGGGSPRFQISFADKNVFVYLGPSPSFTGCARDWHATGNLIGNNDQCRWDTSQIAAGTQCTTYSSALALLGSRTVTGIQLVVDSGWFFADKEQTVLVRNVEIDGHRFVVHPKPEPKPKPKPKPDRDGHNPAQLCRAQRAALGEAAFRQLWGTNANRANAFGKCVSAMAKAKHRADDVHRSILNAAKRCKAERRHDPAAFEHKYRNLGQCVSAHAKAKTKRK